MSESKPYKHCIDQHLNEMNPLKQFPCWEILLRLFCLLTSSPILWYMDELGGCFEYICR